MRAVDVAADELAVEAATDGSAAQVRALLDEVDPTRRLVDRFAVHGATLDDVFLALTGRPADRSEDDQHGEHEQSKTNKKEPVGV